MTETKQNWEEDFDQQFGDPMTKRYGPGFALYCSICSTKGEIRDKIKDFIRKVREEAIQEDRKRIETEANDLLASEVYWDGMTFVEQSIVGGNILINNGIKKVLKVVKNIK